MPRGGHREGAGRRPGDIGKRTFEVERKLIDLGCDPIEAMAKICKGDVPCTACVDGTVTLGDWYRVLSTPIPEKMQNALHENPELFKSEIRDCPMCGGTLKEYVTTRTRFDAAKELAPYVAPKLKSSEVEVTSETRQRPDGLAALNELLDEEDRKNGKKRQRHDN